MNKKRKYILGAVVLALCMAFLFASTALATDRAPYEGSMKYGFWGDNTLPHQYDTDLKNRNEYAYYYDGGKKTHTFYTCWPSYDRNDPIPYTGIYTVYSGVTCEVHPLPVDGTLRTIYLRMENLGDTRGTRVYVKGVWTLDP